MKTFDPTEPEKNQPKLYAGPKEPKSPPVAELKPARDRRLSNTALDMLAQQSTSVLRQMLELFLADYRGVCSELPDLTRRSLVESVVGHQAELVREMPAAVLADLFLRAKTINLAAKPDDQLVKDLLEID